MNSSQHALSQQASDFYLAEFQALRKEIEWNVEHLRRFEVYAVITTGTIWGFLLAHGGDYFRGTKLTYRFAALVPLFVSVASWLRSRGQAATVQMIGKYIQEHVEPKFTAEGWERFLRDPKNNDSGRQVKVADQVVWIGLIAVNIIFFVIAWRFANK